MLISLSRVAQVVPGQLVTDPSWPFVQVLARLGLGAVVGIFVGLERELSGKVGVRTFALTGLFGCLAGLLGHPIPAGALAVVAVLIIIMNWGEMMVRAELTLTTSVALLVVTLCGILAGEGHLFTPVAGGVITAALLAWKKPIVGFVRGITDQEVRAAILLAILSAVVFPVLPNHPVDRFGLIEPRSNWASVVIIAALGFVNYVLLRILGPKGMEITAFFGGLVNSRKVVVELITRLRDNRDALLPVVYRGMMLATGAMAVRNILIVAILSPRAAIACVIPLGAMLLTSAVLWWRHADSGENGPTVTLSLESPFRLTAALQFGAVFLLLNVAGALAQRYFGSASFYFVSALGGLLSSGSSITSAATLIDHHQVPMLTGVNGIIISSITSILINLPLVAAMPSDAPFRRRLSTALALIAVAGVLGVVVNHLLIARIDGTMLAMY